MKRTLFKAAFAAIAFAASVTATGTLSAQTKAETKLYNTAITKGDLKSANKFLAKFPSSVYAPEIQRMKDSIVFNSLNANDVLAYISFVEENPKSYFKKDADKKIEELNTSSISATTAMEIALEAGFSKDEILSATGVKNRNKENVVAILAPKGGYFTLATISENNGKWEKSKQVEESVYTNDSALEEFSLIPDCKAVTVNGVQHLYFAYTNSSSKSHKMSNIPNNNKELVLNLYSMDDNSVYNVMFSGIQKDGILYGSSMETVQGGLMANPQQTYLMRQLASSENLKPYDKELFRTEETINWWYENNPANSGNLQFGVVPDNSELVQKFKQNKSKEEVGQYTVAMFDIMHNTVVVVYNKADKKYSLAVCQKMPVEKNDIELNTFYGEKGNTLVLYYYKGKTSIKKRLNLGSKRMF